MSTLSPDVVHAALTAIYPVTTGPAGPRHPVMLPPPPNDPLDLALPDEPLDEHDLLDDAEKTP